MKLYLLMLLIIGGVVSAIGDIFLKKWALEDRHFYYGVGLLLYLIGVIFFSMTLREKNLGAANTILEATNIVALVLISYFYFHEKLSQYQIAGIALCILGVILLEVGD